MVVLLDHIAKFLLFLSDAPSFWFTLNTSYNTVALAFLLRHPLVLSLHRLVVACCFTSVAGTFAAHPSFG
jgi:hypothetical protein